MLKSIHDDFNGDFNVGLEGIRKTKRQAIGMAKQLNKKPN